MFHCVYKMISLLFFLCKGMEKTTRPDEQHVASCFDPRPQGMAESLYRNTGDLLRQYAEAIHCRNVVLSFGKDVGKGDMVAPAIPFYRAEVPGRDSELEDISGKEVEPEGSVSIDD